MANTTVSTARTVKAGAVTVFPTEAARDAFHRTAAAYGANYFTEYRDTRGFGLSWAVVA